MELKSKSVPKNQNTALIIPVLVCLSVFSPTAIFCAEPQNKQLAVLSEQSKTTQAVSYIQSQLGAMNQEVTESVNSTINDYLSLMSPAFKAAFSYFSDALRQYCSWLVVYGKQNMNLPCDSSISGLKITPVSEQF